MRTPALLVSAILGLFLFGCGGGSRSSASNAGGKAILRVRWPDRSRLIPATSNSLLVSISKGGQVVKQQPIARPSDSTTTQTTFDGLPVGSLTVSVKAFPSSDGTGIAQASGGGTLETKIGSTASVTVSLISTAQTLSVAPNPSSVLVGQSIPLTANAKDASGNMVLLEANGAQESIVWSTNSPGTAVVSGTGATASLTGVAAGSTSVRASLKVNDVGAVVTGSADVTVSRSTGLADSPWAKFRGDECNSGLGKGRGATGVKRWEFTTGGAVVSSPAIGEDGTIYVGSFDHKVYALDGATGAKRWEFLTGAEVTSSPAVGSNGLVYVRSENGVLYALNGSSGTKVWDRTVGGVRSSVAIKSDGTVYVTGTDQLIALDGETGAVRWEVTGLDPGKSSPAVGLDGTVYLAAENTKFESFDGVTGARQWVFDAHATSNTSSPALASGRAFFVGDSALYCLDSSNGAQIWKFSAFSLYAASAAIGPQGNVIIQDGNGRVYSVDSATGSQRWSVLTSSSQNGGTLQSSPSIASDGTVYLGSSDGILYALNGATGARLWSFSTGGLIESSPAIGSDGTVYFGSYDSKVYAIR